MCVYICVYISSRFQWASFCCSVIIISCLDVTLKTDDSIVRLSLIHLKIKIKYTHKASYTIFKAWTDSLFFHVGDVGLGMGVGSWWISDMKREQSLCIAVRAHMHRASSRRWDFCNSSTWLMLMEKYPVLGQSFRIYAQAQMYNLLKFQPRLCCQSIPPLKSKSIQTQGPSFFFWHLCASS